MKSLKAVLVLLLAWTFSVQAIASASMLGCRHSGEKTSAATQSRDQGQPAAADAHAMHGGGHAGHVMAMNAPGADSVPPQAAVLDALNGCDCGCHCVSHHCTSSVSGLTCNPAAGVTRTFADVLRPAREQYAPLSAYARDLIRPPSIT